MAADTATKHTEPHPLAGKTVIVHPKVEDPNSGIVEGAEYWIEDWADRVFGRDWGSMQGNPTAFKFAFRMMGDESYDMLDDDDYEDVVYGKFGAFSNLMRVSELGDVVRDGR